MSILLGGCQIAQYTTGSPGVFVRPSPGSAGCCYSLLQPGPFIGGFASNPQLLVLGSLESSVKGQMVQDSSLGAGFPTKLGQRPSDFESQVAFFGLFGGPLSYWGLLESRCAFWPWGDWTCAAIWVCRVFFGETSFLAGVKGVDGRNPASPKKPRIFVCFRCKFQQTMVPTMLSFVVRNGFRNHPRHWGSHQKRRATRFGETKGRAQRWRLGERLLSLLDEACDAGRG